MTETAISENIAELSRSKRLKSLTHQTHDALDQSIMAAASFDDLAGYARFAAVQYLFHRDIAALYDDVTLQGWLSGLSERRRLALIAADLADLGEAEPDATSPAVFSAGSIDAPTALGWLYVAEGSNMGAALLRKEVAKIGLSDTYGARHLAPASEGPAANWRSFTSALDALPLSSEEEDRVVAGANAAFARVQAFANARLG